ncbi:hypothetical protein ACN38_g8987 [Penicillium nordicum]|uniref:Uncharacterized protein n=1 Tax=Penicillium nordicum TaxID=229535 RepID=A0A0M9WDA1_9EURO|nr:hypothetical protein ACN38_g8987 [Penicillium nordicum]
MGLWTMVWIIRFHALQVRLKDSQMIIKMASTSNGTCLVCPICPDPNAWKGQLIGSLLGMLALGLVLGTVVWIVWFHALQVRFNDPQMLISAEYLEERKKTKTTITTDGTTTTPPNDAINDEKPTPRLAILCDSPPAELPGSGETPRSKARLYNSG